MSRSLRVCCAAAIALQLVAGCKAGDLLNEPTPNSVPETTFDNPAYATLMVNSVVGDFECGFNSFVVAEGLASDELRDASLANVDWSLDRRDNAFSSGPYGTSACNTNTGIYTPLSTVRAEADRALQRLATWTDAQVPNRQALIAQSSVYAGFSYAALGMAICQAAFDLGPLVDQKGMFALAEKRFTEAIAAADPSSQSAVISAARVGRARVRLYQHDAAGAAADAQLVPQGFVLNASRDATNLLRRSNRVYVAVVSTGTATVEPSTRALRTENGELDPRSETVKVTRQPADGIQTLFVPVKYNAATATVAQAIPIPIARYEEARLILAEAQGGAAAVSIINALRATVNLKPYTGAQDAASIKTLIAAERQRVLFLEGVRAFDVERLELPFDPPAGSVYEKDGKTYGSAVCFPVPDIEVFGNSNIVRSQIISGVRGEFPLP